MESTKPENWNSLVYFVSEVYLATQNFKSGQQSELGDKIRKSAVSLTATLNEGIRMPDTDFSSIYPILSSISVLETYLELAKKYRFLRDTSRLEESLQEVKDLLFRVLGEK